MFLELYELEYGYGMRRSSQEILSGEDGRDLTKKWGISMSSEVHTWCRPWAIWVTPGRDYLFVGKTLSSIWTTTWQSILRDCSSQKETVCSTSAAMRWRNVSCASHHQQQGCKSTWNLFGEHLRCETLRVDDYKEYLPTLSRSEPPNQHGRAIRTRQVSLITSKTEIKR